MALLDLNRVTCIAITSVKVGETLDAINRCKDAANFYDVKLVTSSPVEVSAGIKNELCKPLKSLADYSHYMLYDLHRHIDSDYALIVQHDGYIRNPDKWSDEFYNYDYIGAIWEHQPMTPFKVPILVGNGGFSFRSKKLIELPMKVWVPWETNEGDFYTKEEGIWYGEDTNICVHNRHIYEKNGCVFAPPEVAVKFSQESQTPMTQGVIPFGYHRIFKN